MPLKYSLLIGFLILSFPNSSFSSSFIMQRQNMMIPAHGKTFLFVGQDGDTLREYVKHTDMVPKGVMFYTSVQRMEGLESSVDIGAGPQYADALLKDYPEAQLQIGLYMVGVLDKIVDGQYDQNLFKFSEWLRLANRPVYLRIGYEFDNPENQYDPHLYKSAYIYIVDYLRSKKLSNIAFVWHSYTAAVLPHPWSEYYPGDAYVDWFGASIFSTGNIPYAKKLHLMSQKHNKPFMIAEASPAGMYTMHGKKDWFRHIFRFIEENNIEAFSYINSNWDAMPMFEQLKWGDARIENDPEIKTMWIEEITKNRFKR